MIEAAYSRCGGALVTDAWDETQCGECCKYTRVVAPGRDPVVEFWNREITPVPMTLAVDRSEQEIAF
jgi:hypothetical protein